MSKLLELKMELYNKEKSSMLEELFERIDKSSKLKNQGEEEESQQLFDELKKKIDNLTKNMEEKEIRVKDEIRKKVEFPKEGETFAEGNNIRLHVISKKEKEDYLSLAYIHSVMKNKFEEESFRESLWKELISANVFTCSIYEKQSNKYVGYCSIKMSAESEWEVVIELLPETCGKGYGSEALALFLKTVGNLQEKRTFRARVELDNYASQKMMRKIGATPNGISEFLLYGDQIKKFKEKYKYLITDKMKTVAKEFEMEAEDILGYVLEYRIETNKI